MIIKLTNVDVNVLRTLFDRSLSVSNSLNFKISSSMISSSTTNEDTNFWKEWAVATKGIFESEEFDEIKVLFSNGVYFKNKLLGLFSGQKCDITITCNGSREAESFEIVGQTTFGKPLKVNMRTTRYEMAAAPMEDDLHSQLFDKENGIIEFDIESNIISEINKLRGLNTMCDNPVAYVTFKGGDGMIKAFDSSFEFEIDSYDGAPFEAKFPKKSLGLIDHEPMSITFCHTDAFEFDWFIITGKNAMIQSESVAMLMTSMVEGDEINDDIFGDDTGWGMNND